MGAQGVIAHYSKMKDVSFERTDGSPVADLDSPIYYSSASKLYMGPVSGGGPPGSGSFSLGVSTGGNTAGQTGITGTRVVLAGGGEISLSQLTDAGGATITVSAPSQSVQTQNRFNLTLAGNTAGALQEVSSGTLTLAGGANVTLSQNGNAITISAGGGAETQTFVAGVGNSETTYTSGTVRLSELGAVTIRSTTGQQLQISVAPQSVQPETQTFLGGVAASNTTYTSGTVSIVGAGDITVQSGTGQRVIISGSQSVQPETQTFIGGISASDTLYTSGTVRFTGVGGGVTVSSNTGQRIDISVAAPVAQTGTQFSAGISGGNTAGQTGTVAGRLVLAGGNRITLSGATNGASATVTISAPNAQTGISSIAASNATYTSGQVEFTGSGIVTIRSSAGQRVVVDASQSVQTQERFDLTISGNTSGAGALVSSGTLTLAGGNNITLSQAGNAITISGANVGGAQTGISGIANSQTTYTSGTVSLSELGAITIRSTTGNQFQLSVNPQSVQPETQTFVGGIAGSDTTYTSGTVRFTGVGGGITVSSNTGQRIDLSVAAPVNFSGGISGGNTSGDTGATGTRLVFAGGNNVTLSGATDAQGGTITISGANIGGAQTGISGLANSETTYTSGTVSLSELGAITIRSTTGNQFQLSVDSQSNQTLGLFALGNTTGQSSSTTRDARSVSLRGDGIVSLGFSAGTLRISASQSVQPETQTFVGGVAGSDLTVTSGTVEFTGSNIVTVRSSAGQRIVIDASVAAQTNQTLGMFALGNTTGESSSTTRDARSLSVRGDGIVSVGYSNGSLRISASQSVQPETQTFIAGLANSETTYTSGTVNLSGLGAITVRSTTGNAFQLSVAAQTAESQSIGMSNLGNTSGTTGIASGAQVRMLFAGGNNITLSQSLNGASGTLTISAASQTNQTLGLFAVQNTTGQSSSTTRDARSISVAGDGAVSVGYSAGSLRISAPVQTGTQFSGGLTNVGNTAGDTGTVAGRLVLVGSNNITLSGSTNGASETISIIGGAGGAFSGGVSDVGNTAGDTGITGSRLVLSGGQSITLSQSTNASGATVQISGASTSQSVQSLGMYAVQNTTGQSSSTTMDARTLSIAGDGAVSVGYSAGSLRISAPVQTVESQSIGMSNLGNTSGTTGVASGGQVRFLIVGGNNVTLSQSLDGASGTLTISAFNQTGTQFSAGLTNVGNTAGDTGTVAGRLVLVGSNNITLSGSTNGASETISIIGGAGGAGFSAGISGGNTSGDTGITGTRLVFAGGNSITLSGSTDANGGSVTVSAPNASVLSAVAPLSTSTNGSTISILGPAQLSVGFSTQGNTSGDTGFATARLALVGSNGITLSGSTNAGSQTITISGITQTGTQFSAGISGGNTAGDTGTVAGRVVLAGGANITLSGSTDGASETISIVGGAGGAGFSAGVSDAGNTAGATGVTGTRLVLVGTNNITLSQTTGAAGATISISGGGGGAGFSAGVSTGGNTAGATGLTGSQLVLVGTNAISLSQTTGANGGTVSIDAPATSSLVGTNGVSISTNGSTISIMDTPLTSLAPYDESPMVTGQQGQGSLHMAPLRIPAQLQIDRVGLAVQFSNATNSSFSFTISNWFGLYTRNASSVSLLGSTSISTNFSGSGTVGSYSLYAGPGWMTIPWTTTLPPDDYYVAIISRTTTGGGAGHSLSQLLLSKFTNSAFSGIIGAATNATNQRNLGQGHYSATTSAFPASIAFSQIQGTGSIVMRSPVYMLRSGTV